MIDNVNHKITLHFVDGQRGDDDQTENGRIVDDGGPGFFNNLPQVKNQSFIVNENSPNGTMVGTGIATDPDAGQVLSYSLVSGDTDTFAINPATDQITVADSSALDFEAQSAFALTVKVTDDGSPVPASSTATITIALNPVADAPTLTIANATGAEGAAIPLAISADLVDTDGSENLAITIAGVPTNATLSAGSNNCGVTEDVRI